VPRQTMTVVVQWLEISAGFSWISGRSTAPRLLPDSSALADPTRGHAHPRREGGAMNLIRIFYSVSDFCASHSNRLVKK